MCGGIRGQSVNIITTIKILRLMSDWCRFDDIQSTELDRSSEWLPCQHWRYWRMSNSLQRCLWQQGSHYDKLQFLCTNDNTWSSHSISMAKCKTAVSPLLKHWRHCSLALSHQYVILTWLSSIPHTYLKIFIQIKRLCLKLPIANWLV